MKRGFSNVIGIILIALVLILGGVTVYQSTRQIGTGTPDGGVVCTADAKLCPDGSYVGRTGPKCEFASCPTNSGGNVGGGGTGNLACTSDAECPSSKYQCEAIQGAGTACPNTDPSCKPTFKIIQGQCKIREGNSCTATAQCASGYYCYQGLCTNPVGRQCQGQNDTSCGPGYSCIQSCGPPISRENDPPPPFYCELNELAKKPRVCPICLASNTMIATPGGDVPVTEVKVGTIVWTKDSNGEKIARPVIEIGHTAVPPTHTVVHVVLSDGREVYASGNHPTASGKKISELRINERYDGAEITSLDVMPYWDKYTYDILPEGTTGLYFANGIVLKSTLVSDNH